MLHNEARELLVQGYEATHDAKGIAKAYSVSKWTVYRLAEQKRKTGSVALRTSQRGRKPVLTALTGLVGGVFVFLTDYDGPPEGGVMGKEMSLTLYLALMVLSAVLVSVNLYLAICAPWKPGDPEKPRPRRSAISSKYLLRAAVISFLIALALFCIPPWP